jgi:hypothetical protein
MQGLLQVKVQQKRRTFASAWKRRYHVFDAETCSLKSFAEDMSEVMGSLDVVGVVADSSSQQGKMFMKGKLSRMATSSGKENRFDVLVTSSDEAYCLAAGAIFVSHALSVAKYWCVFFSSHTGGEECLAIGNQPGTEARS